MPKIKMFLKTYRWASNPLEKVFADAWEKICGDGRHLACLLDSEGRSSPPYPHDRDYLVAGTVIQWLGSPVGQGFLRDLGFVRADTTSDEALVRTLQDFLGQIKRPNASMNWTQKMAIKALITALEGAITAFSSKYL